MENTKNQTTFTYPVEKICGKISRHSKVIHACTASGKQTTYLQGERDLVNHPVTTAEIARQTLFKTRQAKVAARLKKTASTYATDWAAFQAQLDSANGAPTFLKYLWNAVIAAEDED